MTDEAVVQILKAINDFREDFKDEKRKNEKRWEQNEKRWKENDKRWKENKQLWEENKKRWQEYDIKRELDRKHLLGIFDKYEMSVDNMYKENKNRIIKIEKLCPKCKIKTV